MLARIAASLDRLVPLPPESVNPSGYPAYIWRGQGLGVARAFSPLPLDLLTGIAAQKQALVENSQRLARGHAAHDVLLWGSRGAGKSALVKSTVGALQAEGAEIALIEVAGDHLESLPALFGVIVDIPRAFILFIDDLGFADGSDTPRLLRSMLEGGAEARPGNAACT